MRAKKIFENNLFKSKDFSEIIKSKFKQIDNLTLDSKISIIVPKPHNSGIAYDGWYFDDFAKEKYNVKIDYGKVKIDYRKGSFDEMSVTGKVKDIINLYQDWINMDEYESYKHFMRLLNYDLNLKREIKEGVGDTYAKKRFNIPDEIGDFYKDVDRKNEIVGIIGDTPIIKNPQNLEKLPEDARGVITKSGNMYFVDPNELIHDSVLRFLDTMGEVDYNKQWNVKIPKNFLTVQRVDKTNKIKLGESNLFAYPKDSIYYSDAQKFQEFSEEEKNKLINYFFKKAKEKNPQFVFLNKSIRVFEKKSINDLLKPKSEDEIKKEKEKIINKDILYLMQRLNFIESLNNIRFKKDELKKLYRYVIDKAREFSNYDEIVYKYANLIDLIEDKISKL